MADQESQLGEPGTPLNDYEMSKLDQPFDIICQRAAAEIRELRAALAEYGTHDWRCILSQWHASDPEKGQKFGDKWYKKGDEPPCTCGLTAVLTGKK